MSNTGVFSRIRGWATSQRNITLFTAILIAIPTAHVFQLRTGGIASSFLLLTTLAVGVPTAYEDYWPKYEQMWKAVVWIIVACLVAALEFTTLYLVGTAVVGLPPFLASIGAFLVTYFGTPMLFPFNDADRDSK